MKQMKGKQTKRIHEHPYMIPAGMQEHSGGSCPFQAIKKHIYIERMRNMAKESISRATFVKGIAAGAIVACSLGALQFTEYSTVKRPSYTFVPGTYTASAPGIESDVLVTITVDDKSITDVSVDVSGETPGIGADIADTVKQQIMDLQSSGIDGVSGATITSTAVKEALDAAIVKAEAGDTSVPETAAPETEAPAADTTEGSGTPAAAYGSYTPGTYTATAKGIESDVKVDVTVDESSITDVAIDVSGETAGIGADIGDQMAEKFLAAQSADVDVVAGASITSNALMQAMADALAQASAGTEAEEAVTEDASAQTAAAAGSYVPGTYTATAKGIESDVKVDVTVDESSITDVAIDVSGETAGIGADIGDQMAEKFLAAQSADVDVVAGASITSNALMQAMADALAQASAGAEAAPEQVTEAVQEEAVTEDTAAVEAVTEDAAVEAVTEAEEATVAQTASAAMYVPGTYTATAKGIESDVKVDVTVDESSITDIAVDVSGETAGIGADIGDQMVEKFLAAQSADVDVVAGASITSNALMQAMADALAQASSGTEAAVETVAEEAQEEAETESTAAEEAVTEGAAEEAVTEDTAAEEAVTEAEETAAAEAGSAAVYVPGTYSAVAKGMESYVLVETTVDETSITGVTIDVSGETQGIGAAIGDQMAEAILEAQSADVDAVAGATVSSGAVIEALSHTLSEAAVKGEDQAEEAQEAVTENEAAGGIYTAGTYSASAAGISSDVKVEAEFDASSITNVTVDVSGETQGIGAAIGDQMAEAILEAQSADVETVSGATITSEAVKKAMEDVIAQAGGK